MYICMYAIIYVYIPIVYLNIYSHREYLEKVHYRLSLAHIHTYIWEHNCTSRCTFIWKHTFRNILYMQRRAVSVAEFAISVGMLDKPALAHMQMPVNAHNLVYIHTYTLGHTYMNALNKFTHIYSYADMLSWLSFASCVFCGVSAFQGFCLRQKQMCAFSRLLFAFPFANVLICTYVYINNIIYCTRMYIHGFIQVVLMRRESICATKDFLVVIMWTPLSL